MPDVSAGHTLADRDWLFGLLALESDAISRAQFIEGCSEWAADKRTSLAAFFEQRGWLSKERRTALEQMVECKLTGQGGQSEEHMPGATPPALQPTIRHVADDARESDVDFILNTDVEAATDNAPRRLRYDFGQLHAKGGMGQVWLATDRDLGRSVALKELRPESLKHPTIIARFLEEARITGQLEHPAIIPVYELVKGGLGELPFYTMRFIRGRSLFDAVRAYHEKRKKGQATALEFRDLLTAFTAVCNAIAYAHSRGVIHRDLKCSNVVLGDFGEVMVLDWGLAKVITPGAEPEPKAGDDVAKEPEGPFHIVPSPSLSLSPAASELTMQGQVLGTPSYMAPEQAQGRTSSIDTLTDVYCLGAMLYEIITGFPPFYDKDALVTIRLVITTPPQPPRQRVSSVPPALEAVCLKALSKEPSERYPSAAALAREIQRFLADEPVSAFADPFHVRALRWAKRNRTLVSSVAALLVTAVIGLTIGMVLLGQANRQIEEKKELAETHRLEAEQNLVLAQQEKQKAQKSDATSTALNKFLIDGLLGQANPDRNPRAKHITVEEVIGLAADNIDGAFPNNPEVEAAVCVQVGEMLYRLGQYQKALDQLKKALPIRTRILGANHAQTLYIMNLIIEIQNRMGNFEEALQTARQIEAVAARSFGPDHDATMTARNELARDLQAIGRFADAEPIYVEQVNTRRRVKGPDHPWTLNAMNNLAQLHLEEGKFADAEAELRTVVSMYRGVLPDNIGLGISLSNLGRTLTETGKMDEAQKTLDEAIKECIRIQGDDTLYTAVARMNLNHLLVRSGKWKEAESLCPDNLKQCQKLLPTHPRTWMAMDNLAEVLLHNRQYDEAKQVIDLALAARRKSLLSHPDIAISLEMLGRRAMEMGSPKEAEQPLREALDIRRKSLVPDCWLTAQTASELAGVLIDLKKYSEAEPMLLGDKSWEGAYQILEKSCAPPAYSADARKRIVELYEKQGDSTKAAYWRSKAKPGS
jgi:serine/threonine protein kinase/predicted negative regulator of RcsB-dependent stress response